MITLVKNLFLDSGGKEAQELLKKIASDIYHNAKRTDFYRQMGVILDARQELFLTSLYIQLFYNNYLRGRIGSMFKRCAQEKDRVTLCSPYYPYMHTLTRPFLNRMYIG